MSKERRRIILMVLGVLLVGLVVSMPVAAAMGKPFWTPLEVTVTVVLPALLFVLFVIGGAVVAFVACIIALGCVFTLWFSVAGFSRAALDHRRLVRSLSRTRRTTWEKLPARLDGVPGTLIIEARTLGWCTANYWWTSGDVGAEAAEAGVVTPPPPALGANEMEQPDPLTPFCIERYLDVHHGDAVLVYANLNPWSSRRAERLARFFQAAHPGTPRVVVSLPLYRMLAGVAQEKPKADGTIA